MDLNAWMDEAGLVVCVGSGGVGKTTTAATLGLWAALRGRRVMVLTIDPAKRLANSLGLERFGNSETRIDLAGLPETQGELWAMMLDSRSTWDSLIARVAPTDAVRERILHNRVFRVMADTFAGSQEYMATEKLYDLVSSGSYDLVVLDTPPVKNALDFLESPGRLISFLDEKILGWFLSPYDRATVFGSLMGGASTVFFRLLGTLFGSDFVDDLTELMRDFKELYEGFRTRHTETLRLFRATTTHFVTVCAPTESSVEVAEFFQAELRNRELQRTAVIVNQVHSCQAAEDDAAAVLGPHVAAVGGVDTSVTARLLARLSMAHRRLRDLAAAERILIDRAGRAATGVRFFCEIPRLDDDVCDLQGLHEVGRALFPSS